MHTSIPRIAAATAVAMAIALTGCSGGGAAEVETDDEGNLVIDGELIADAETLEAAQEEGSLTFYTGGSEQSEQQAADAFTEDTGIDVEIVRLAPNQLSERILSETAGGQLGADVIRISGEDLIVGLADGGAFEPTTLGDDIESATNPDAIFDDGLYYSSFDRVYSFAYNDQVVTEDAPEDWADLLDGDWQGGLGIVQVGAGGSTAALTRFQLGELGEEYLEDYAATDPTIFDSSASLTDALARGEIAAGPVPVATAYASILDGAPLTIALPEEGVAAYPFYLGQGSDADSPNAATVFINWLMSAQGQELAASIGDYPVHDDMPNPTIGDTEMPAADSGFVFRATLDESLDNLESDADTWSEIFGYTG